MFKELAAIVFGFFGISTPTCAVPVVGQPAPAITLKTDFDLLWRLSDHKGKWVVLFFLPSLKGFFGFSECANQMCAISSKHHEFKKQGAIAVGIEAGSVKFLQNFRQAKHLSKDIILLSDCNYHSINAYGTGGGWFSATNRETFIINPDGKIAHVIKGHSMDGNKHMNMALDWLKQKQSK